jgi:hypothetical protein
LGAQEFGEAPLSVDEGTPGAALPADFDLLQSYPNPFYLSDPRGNSTTRIEFAAGENAAVRLEVLNILGQHVRTLLEGEISAGRHAVVWDGRDKTGAVVASGVYVYCLAGIVQTSTRRATMATARPTRATARLLFLQR